MHPYRFSRLLMRIGVFVTVLAGASRSLRSQVSLAEAGPSPASELVDLQFAAELALVLGPSRAPNFGAAKPRLEPDNLIVRADSTTISGVHVWFGYAAWRHGHSLRVAEYHGKYYRAGGFTSNDLYALAYALPPVVGIAASVERARALVLLDSDGEQWDALQVAGPRRADQWPDTAYANLGRIHVFVTALGYRTQYVVQHHLIFTSDGHLGAWAWRSLQPETR